MTKLGCNVKSCTNNKDNCCCLSSIKVEGDTACNCDSTCCASYEEANGATNSTNSPNLSLSIACDACNCIYNTDKHCNADHVDISGIRATESDETVCATFCCK